MGIGRDWRVNSTEDFGLHRATTGYGGMCVQTRTGSTSYYGYGEGTHLGARTYYAPSLDQWRLRVGGIVMVVDRALKRTGSPRRTPPAPCT